MTRLPVVISGESDLSLELIIIVIIIKKVTYIA